MNILPWHKIDFDRLIAGKDHLPHALLVHGRQGIGKLLFAQGLAQSLLCENPLHSGPACERCAACRWFDSANHPDFRLIEPEALTERADQEEAEEGAGKKPSLQITIEQIRELAGFVNISSHRRGRKVTLIHPAEALNVNAANALLKSLEEPPAGTHFVLVTHRVDQLLPTVRSRCQYVGLPGPERGVAIEWLRAQGVPEPALALAQTGNSPLLAQQLAGQDYWQQRDFLLKSMTGGEFDPLLLAEQIRDYAVRDVVSWLQKWTFDLIFQKLLGRVRYNPDQETAIAALAARIETVNVLRFHREIVRLQRVVNHPLNARLFIEQLLLDYAGLLEAGTGRASRAA